MELQQARLIGIAHCIVPQQIMDPSILMQPPIPLQKMLKPQPIAVAPNLLQPLQPPPSIVQIIVPAPLVQLEPVHNNLTEQLTTEVASTQDPTTTSSTAPFEVKESDTSNESQKEENNETHQHSESDTVENMAAIEEKNAPPADMIGNVIHEVYSPVPEVLQPIERQQALSAEPEEPPEAQDDEDLQDDLT